MTVHYANQLQEMTKQIKVIATQRMQAKVMAAAPPQLTLEEIKRVQNAACALAAAAKAECDFYTALVLEIEPP